MMNYINFVGKIFKGIVGVQKNGGSFIYDELQKYIICLDQVKLIFLM